MIWYFLQVFFISKAIGANSDVGTIDFIYRDAAYQFNRFNTQSAISYQNFELGVKETVHFLPGDNIRIRFELLHLTNVNYFAFYEFDIHTNSNNIISERFNRLKHHHITADYKHSRLTDEKALRIHYKFNYPDQTFNSETVRVVDFRLRSNNTGKESRSPCTSSEGCTILVNAALYWKHHSEIYTGKNWSIWIYISIVIIFGIMFGALLYRKFKAKRINTEDEEHIYETIVYETSNCQSSKPPKEEATTLKHTHASRDSAYVAIAPGETSSVVHYLHPGKLLTPMKPEVEKPSKVLLQENYHVSKSNWYAFMKPGNSPEPQSSEFESPDFTRKEY